MFSLDLGNLLVHLKLESDQWTRVMRNVETRMTRAENRLNSFGRNMTMKVTVPLLALGVASIKTFASFDDAMVRSTAIMGNVTDDMDADMRSLARTLSMEGVQSATQLAESYFFLASAGLDVKQSIAALPVVQKFATAGAFEMALATDLVTDAQSALGLTVNDSQQNMTNMVKITDILTGANTLANASTQQFSEALMRAGPAMKAYGIELEDGVATLAAYADQGKKGAEGGELFGRMLRLMIKGFNDNREAWDRYNISIVDAQDNLRPMADIVRDLTGVLGTMGVTEKAAALELLGFQARSQQAVMPLLGLGNAIEQYNKDLHQMAGITEEVANKQLKSLGSQLRIIWIHVKAVAASFGSTLEPMVLKVGEGVKTFAKFWLNLNKETQRTVGIVAVLAASLGPIALAMALIVKVGALVVGVFAAMNVAALGVAASMLKVLVPLIAVVAAGYTFRTAWIENIGGVQDKWNELKSTIEDVNKSMNAVLYSEGKAGKAFQGMAGLGGSFGGGITYPEGTSFHKEISALKDLVNKPYADSYMASDKGKRQVETIIGSIVKGLMPAGTLPQQQQPYEWPKDKFEGLLPPEGQFDWDSYLALPQLDTTINNVVQKEVRMIDLVRDQMKKDFDSIKNLLMKEFPELADQIDISKTITTGEGLGEWRQKIYKELDDAFKSAVPIDAMSEESIWAAWDRMYDGLNDKSAEYFNFQQKKLEKEVELWQKNASVIAKQFDMEKDAVLNLIDVYEKEQRVLIEIAELKQGGWADGLKAFAMESTRTFKTAGEKAFEFAQSMERSVSNGLQGMSRDMDNWGAHALRILEDIYFEAIRIAFIQPVASGLASSFAGAFAQPSGAVSSGQGPSLPHYAEGGIAWKPQIASLAENEPELITPFSELRKMQDTSKASGFSLHIENITNMPIEAEDIDFDPDRMIANITIRDKRNRGPVSRASRSRG